MHFKIWPSVTLRMQKGEVYGIVSETQETKDGNTVKCKILSVWQRSEDGCGW